MYKVDVHVNIYVFIIYFLKKKAYKLPDIVEQIYDVFRLHLWTVVMLF